VRSSTKFPYLDVEITEKAWILPKRHGVEIEFGYKQGRGWTGFRAIVLTKNFEELAQAMMKANSGEAIKAFGAAMQAGIQSPPKG
jgi:hypothetical protein